ncbi:MAG: PQQ-like beta-propeller repeat protein [Deltaproteobacteria bacterium]|nr:PQQ-like beta-propeller repeat protein [Deltaproteobacteria bacterium]
MQHRLPALSPSPLPILFALTLLGCEETPSRRPLTDASQHVGDFDGAQAKDGTQVKDDAHGGGETLPHGDGVVPPRPTWASRFGGLGGETVFDGTLDKTENLLLTGTFSGTWHLAKGDISAVGAGDIFVAKIDPNGNMLWATSAGGSSSDEAYAISAADDGTVFITGDYGGKATFGATTLTPTKTDVFVAKLDASGKFLWAKSLGGSEIEVARGVAADGSGGTYVVGRYEGMAHFGTHSLTASPAGKAHGFVARLDAKGAVLWAVDIGSPGEASCHDVILAKSGPVISGWFTGSVDIAGTQLTSQGETDGFVAKLDPAGKTIWATAIARGTASGWGGELALSGDNIVVAGSFRETATFGKTSLTSKDAVDFYVTALDTTGKVLWASTAGGDGNALAFCVATGSAGEIIIAGTLSKSTTIGGKALVPHKGGGDILIAKFSSDGKAIWATSGGGDGGDRAYGVVVSPTEKKIYALGNFEGEATFGSDTIQAQGNSDIVVWKLNLP